MYKKYAFLFLICFSALLQPQCSRKLTVTPAVPQRKSVSGSNAGPRVIVYKTKKDYYRNVPVTLTEDGKTLSSYPDIRDVYYQGKLAYPARLKMEYLLDNRGISSTAAFLKYTYEEYSKLKKTPEASELLNLIIDPDPLLEAWDCGTRYEYKDIVNDLNKIIEEGKINQFRKLK